MFGLGLPEIILILVVVLIVFGVGKLPEIGSGLGKAIRGFKRGLSEPNETDAASKKDNSENKKT